MQTCGVCVVNSTDLKCSICPVDVCVECSRTVEISIALPPRPKYDAIVCIICEMQLKMLYIHDYDCYLEIRSNPRYKLCHHCSDRYENNIQTLVLSARYCYTCDTVVGKCEYFHDINKCDVCINHRNIKTRDTSPL